MIKTDERNIEKLRNYVIRIVKNEKTSIESKTDAVINVFENFEYLACKKGETK